ncbi:hypothetical protein D3C86_1555040 [compost metagenome]
MRELPFLEIGIHPQPARRHDGQQLAAGARKGAHPGAPVAHGAVHGRTQRRIAQVQFGDVPLGNRLRQRRLGLLLLCADHVQLTLRGEQRGTCALAVGLRLLVVRIRLLRALDGNGGLGHEARVAQLIVAGPHGVGIGRRYPGLGLPDHGLLEARGCIEVGEQRLLGRHGALGLGECGAVIAVVNAYQQVTSPDGLVVRHRHFRDISAHLGANHGDIATDVGIVGAFHEPGGCPPVVGV